MESIDGRYICKVCNKKYTSYKSLWNHNKKYHIHDVSDNVSIVSDNVSIVSDNVSDNVSNKILKCKYCNKIYKHRSSKSQHEKNCKSNKSNKSNKNNEQYEINELKKELVEVKQTLLNLLNSNKIHPKTLQKINKQLINNTNNNSNNITNNTTNNNTTNTINNTTINNTVNIKFGYEKLSDILNEKEMIKILNNCKMCVEESVKIVHFNDKRPEFRNILITNLRDNVAYIFDGNRFIAQNKDYILSELFDKHFGNIEKHILNNEFMRKLNDSILCKYLIEFIDQINGDQTHSDFKNKDGYKIHKINELKNLIYNYSDPKVLKN